MWMSAYSPLCCHYGDISSQTLHNIQQRHVCPRAKPHRLSHVSLTVAIQGGVTTNQCKGAHTYHLHPKMNAPIHGTITGTELLKYEKYVNYRIWVSQSLVIIRDFGPTCQTALSAMTNKTKMRVYFTKTRFHSFSRFPETSQSMPCCSEAALASPNAVRRIQCGTSSGLPWISFERSGFFKNINCLFVIFLFIERSTTHIFKQLPAQRYTNPNYYRESLIPQEKGNFRCYSNISKPTSQCWAAVINRRTKGSKSLRQNSTAHFSYS